MTPTDLIGRLVVYRAGGLYAGRVRSVDAGPRKGFRSFLVNRPSYHGRMGWDGERVRVPAAGLVKVGTVPAEEFLS